jgi:site-specific recombinase
MKRLAFLTKLWQRHPWWSRPGKELELLALLGGADPQAPQAVRHLWLIRVLGWVRRTDPMRGMRILVDALKDDPARRARVVSMLASIWRDGDVAALLADFGFSPRTSFLNELGERLRRRWLPLSPDTDDLGTLFNLLFDAPGDAQWLASLDEPTLDALGELWADAMRELDAAHHTGSAAQLGWREPFHDAMLYLATQIRAAGFSPAFRSRMGVRVDVDFDAKSSRSDGLAPDATARYAFRHLSQTTERVHELALAHAQEAGPDAPASAALLQEAQYLRALLDTCANAARGIHGHLEAHGISMDLVFQIDQLCERCRRMERLLEAVLSPQPGSVLRGFLVELLQLSEDRRSVRALFTQHYSMLARKVAERSAETGEHYITRTRGEYRAMLGSAAGGGAVMVGTTFMKFAVLSLGLPPFWTGVGAGLNYATSFVVVQWLHFTVATKQPAMTAPAMAAKLEDTHSEAGVEDFVDEVAHLIRSQMAGILGNLMVVAPLVLAVQLLAIWALGAPLVSKESAHYVLKSMTLLGPTLWYAAFTGVLLFASSIIAGWVENWFVLHRLDSAMRWNPRIRARLGARRAARWALWWRENISGLAANISLGFMLGVVPVVAQFLALPLDIRHVTLSAGQIAAAVAALGWEGLRNPQLWWCVAAVPLTGMLNVGVSFALAMRVAVRSRGVRLGDRARLWQAIRRRLWRQPLSFLLPPRVSP